MALGCLPTHAVQEAMRLLYHRVALVGEAELVQDTLRSQILGCRDRDQGLQAEGLEFEQRKTELEAAIAAQRKVETDIDQARDEQHIATEQHNKTYGRQIAAQGEIARIEEAIE